MGGGTVDDSVSMARKNCPNVSSTIWTAIDFDGARRKMTNDPTTPQAAAIAYRKAVEAHPTHSSILCKYGGFVKHVENNFEKVPLRLKLDLQCFGGVWHSSTSQTCCGTVG